MKKLLIALIAVGVVAVGFLFFSSGSQSRLEGEIVEVRTLEVQPTAAVALVNFEATNVTSRPFVAYDRRLELVDPDGKRLVGKIVQGVDLQDLFKYFPQLGAMKNEPFLHEGTIEGGETRRGLIAARFEVPEAQIQARDRLVLRLVDGANRPSELTESSE